MNFQQVRHPIDYVIQRVRTGRIALPDFQRDFVWNASDVVELLDSVAKQWPIGSLLLLNGPQPFAFRAIDNGPHIRGSDLDLYILDGQQRVTALYHAVANVSKYCYYVDFNDLANNGYEAIRWERRSKFERDFPDVQARARSGVALISDIWDHSAFFVWLNELQSTPTKEKFIRLREDRLTGLQSKVYHIMAIELEQGIELEALARIFETINRTGVPLNAFDLLVAKLYPTNFNLRNAWEDAKEKYAILVKFKPSELEVLKLLSLIIRRKLGKKHSKGVRQGDLLSLDSKLIVDLWDESVSLYARALNECARFGINSDELMPSWTMILGLAGCLLELDAAGTDAWWKHRILTQTFAQAANTKIVAEFDLAMAVLEVAEGQPATIDPAEILSKPARANGLFTKGMLGLILKRGGLDPVTGKPLSECEKVTLRWVTARGEIRKLTSEDDIGGVILTSDSGHNKTLHAVGQIDDSVRNALNSQGIDTYTFRRDPDFTRKLFQIDGRPN